MVSCVNLDYSSRSKFLKNLEDFFKLNSYLKTIRVKGIVSSVKNYDSFSILKISQSQDMEVFLFDDVEIPIGVTVDIYGKVQEGRDGDIEIVGDVVRIV